MTLDLEELTLISECLSITMAANIIQRDFLELQWPTTTTIKKRPTSGRFYTISVTGIAMVSFYTQFNANLNYRNIVNSFTLLPELFLTNFASMGHIYEGIFTKKDRKGFEIVFYLWSWKYNLDPNERQCQPVWVQRKLEFKQNNIPNLFFCRIGKLEQTTRGSIPKARLWWLKVIDVLGKPFCYGSQTQFTRTMEFSGQPFVQGRPLLLMPDFVLHVIHLLFQGFTYIKIVQSCIVAKCI